ncbi:MAG: glycosyltransferase family 4 protein, partial [Planctomycetota bacterium]|nr:glycosyltransferase family 4 protein [Planctomycetota bacterium]
CDVFVLPSLSEARPRVVIEAMILGKCVVATRTGGLPSLIEEGVTGVLVPPGDVAALASVLDDVIRDGARRRELGMAAQRRAAVAFDPRATVRNYLREYTRALTVPRH